MTETAIAIEIRSEQDIVIARQQGKALSIKMNFSKVNQVRFTTAVSELARNIYLYAGHGTITFETIYGSTKLGIRIIAKDKGPGIKSIRKVLEDGYSTSGGLGMGIPGVKRLMDEFHIESGPAKGTTVIAVKWVFR